MFCNISKIVSYVYIFSTKLRSKLGVFSYGSKLMVRQTRVLPSFFFFFMIHPYISKCLFLMPFHYCLVPIQGQKKKKQDEKQTNNDDPSTAGEFHRKSVDDSYFSRPSPLLAKCPTRRSHTPSARSSYLSNSTSRHVPSPTTSFLSRTISRKSRSLTETEDSSRKGTTSESTEGSSRRGRTLSEAGEGSNRRARTPETTESRSKSTSRRGTTLSETDQNPNISRSGSRRSPIIFSQTTAARRKPPPEERKLSCTLEELCHGSVKNITIKRQIVSDDGFV